MRAAPEPAWWVDRFVHTLAPLQGNGTRDNDTVAAIVGAAVGALRGRMRAGQYVTAATSVRAKSSPVKRSGSREAIATP